MQRAAAAIAFSAARRFVFSPRPVIQNRPVYLALPPVLDLSRRYARARGGEEDFDDDDDVDDEDDGEDIDEDDEENLDGEMDDIPDEISDDSD
ncbi:calsequestrin-1-like [Ananas comosus]|uniref:Calsequestrin-1-like n=1 Tax=Ananas comosus TaxID=4615 RepID=A0A6P5EW77_ANACO|nr:calsequestrin-1-like [Ananas comosus]